MLTILIIIYCYMVIMFNEFLLFYHETVHIYIPRAQLHKHSGPFVAFEPYGINLEIR